MPMRVRHLALLALVLLAAVLSTGAGAADRMLVGIQDDPSFRWRDDRATMLDQAQAAGIQIVRSTVYWSRVAPSRPARPTDPFDPSYSFNDLDELVRNAQQRGMEVMLTIWGTPSWANGGKGQNYAPTNPADLGNFARAVAARYSGRYPGYPFVQYWGIWNESNLGGFLSPQYDRKGKPLAPYTYAKMYRAAYAGIKAANPRALVAIGETSARGRDKFLGAAGASETESPGRFAQILSTIRPKLPFDAYSQHPYPTDLRQQPLAKVRFPNVTLGTLPTFETSLDKWFGRKDIPIWITEYGYQTNPPNSHGVSYATQAAWGRTAIDFARRDPRVQMFIWFIWRDDPTSTWQSGLLQRNSTPKPFLSQFSALAKLVDGRNPVVTVKGTVRNPVARVPVLELAARSGVGAVVGATVRVYLNNQLVGVAQPQTTIGADGYASFPLPIQTASNRTYVVWLEIGDANGDKVVRNVTLVAK
jgi:hypothetical protein